MEMVQYIVLGGIAFYFLIMIIVGLRASQDQSHEGFTIGNRNVGLIPTIGSLASSFRDGMGAVFWVGFGITVGYGGLGMGFGVLVGYLLYAVFGPKVREKANNLNIITVGEMIRHSIGRITEKSSALIVVFYSLILIAVQLFVSGNIFAEVLQIDAWIGVISVACVVGIYLFFGGYSTVVKTDAIQFFLIISFIIVPFLVPPASEDMLNVSSLFSLPVLDQIALFGIGLGYVLSSSDGWQRLFSAKNNNVIRIGFPMAGIAFFLMTLSLIWFGMGAKGLLTGDIDDSRALFDIFTQNALSPWILSYVAIIIMAITMSSLDTFCYLFASSLTKNILPVHKTKNRTSYIRSTRIIMLVALVSMSVVALTISDVIQFLLSASSLVFILSPIYVAVGFGWFKQSKKLDIFTTLSMGVSTIVYVTMFIRGDLENMIMLMVPITLNTAFVILGLLGQRLFAK